MPTYDYKCDKCNKSRTQTISLIDLDTFKAICACGEQMRRILSAPPIMFKGTGWGKDPK